MDDKTCIASPARLVIYISDTKANMQLPDSNNLD